jgi:hypothetical protein
MTIVSRARQVLASIEARLARVSRESQHMSPSSCWSQVVGESFLSHRV